VKRVRGTLRKVITRGSLFLLLGAVINITVAWAIAVWAGDVSGSKHVQARWRGLDDHTDAYTVQWTTPLAVRILRGRHPDIDLIDPYYEGPMTDERWEFIGYCISHHFPIPRSPLESEWDHIFSSVLDDEYLVERAADTAERTSRVIEQAGLPHWYGSPEWSAPVLGGVWLPRIDTAFGWPMMTLRSAVQLVVVEHHDEDGNPEHVELAQHVDWGLRLPDRTITGAGNTIGSPEWHTARMLPLRPIWRGALINSIFYASLLWLLVATPRWLRRRRRIRRGLCPHCAYPIGAGSVCTECGRNQVDTRRTGERATACPRPGA
jgi:hypothetical protein